MRIASWLSAIAATIVLLAVASPALCLAACDSDSRCPSQVAHSACIDSTISRTDCSCCLQTVALPGKPPTERKLLKRSQEAAIPSAVAESAAKLIWPTPCFRKTPEEGYLPPDLFTLHSAFLI